MTMKGRCCQGWKRSRATIWLTPSSFALIFRARLAQYWSRGLLSFHAPFREHDRCKNFAANLSKTLKAADNAWHPVGFIRHTCIQVHESQLAL